MCGHKKISESDIKISAWLIFPKNMHSEFYFLLILLYIIAVAVVGAVFRQGTGPILLSYLECNGTESSLLSCRRRERPGFGYCAHYYDAGVVCPCKLFGTNSSHFCNSEIVVLTTFDSMIMLEFSVALAH